MLARVEFDTCEDEGVLIFIFKDGRFAWFAPGDFALRLQHELPDTFTLHAAGLLTEQPFLRLQREKEARSEKQERAARVERCIELAQEFFPDLVNKMARRKAARLNKDADAYAAPEHVKVVKIARNRKTRAR